MKDPYGNPITCIIYQDGRPFTVVAGGNIYDFDWCPGSGLLAWHLSGSGFLPYVSRFCEPEGQPGTLWLARKTLISNDCGKKRANPIVRKSSSSTWIDWYRPAKPMTGPKAKRRLRRYGYRLIKSPWLLPGKTLNPFDAEDSIGGDTEYCSICEERIFDDPAYLCEHLEWCDLCGRMSGPGADSPCRCISNPADRS